MLNIFNKKLIAKLHRISFSLLLSLFFLVACGQSSWQETLIVITRNAPTTYYYEKDHLAGLEYDLTQAFAESRGIQVEYKVYNSIGEVMSALNQGEGHIAAAGVTFTTGREERVSFSPIYQKVNLNLVCGTTVKKISALDKLSRLSLAIVEGSSYHDYLKTLKAQYPDLSWQELKDVSTENLLAQVNDGIFDCTVVDSNIIAIQRRFLPNLKISYQFEAEQDLAWAISPKALSISEPLNTWFASIKDDGTLNRFIDRYYGFVEVFDPFDVMRYKARITERLTKYTDDFKTAAEAHNINWLVLAAQSYQESHWNPKAKSPTGVRGMMMLTRTTAKEVGVENRLNAQQSIAGGAVYLAKLLKRIPETVQGEDRLWFALAAYNVGMGHLYDARQLAEEQGKNPNLWAEIKTVLPLLSQKKYYKKLKYGYARGMEPVHYVQRIRQYKTVLQESLEAQVVTTDTEKVDDAESE